MPSLVDIFNPSFFMFLGILVLVAALLVVYFESKMREQNHKMASMLSLITCIAEEMNDIKSQPRVGGSYPNQPFNPNSNLETTNINNTHIITTDLIQVSDDSDSDSDSDSNDNDSNSENGSDSDSDSESDSVKEVIEIGEHSDIKVFKLNISSINNIDENNNVDDLADLADLNNLDDLDDLDEDHFSDDSVSVDSNEDNEEKKNEAINILDLNLKSINISNLEEVKNPNSIDYKKFTLNKLRSTVVEKGLVDDSSKLKKNELLKLLGCSNE